MGSDIDTIRKGFAAWSRGDLDGAIVHLDPGIEFLTSGLYPGLDAVYRGHVGFAKFFGDFRHARRRSWPRDCLRKDRTTRGIPWGRPATR